MMVEEPQALLYIIRYQHNHDIIDVISRGKTGEEAFQHYLDKLMSRGNEVSAYRFISATLLAKLGD